MLFAFKYRTKIEPDLTQANFFRTNFVTHFDSTTLTHYFSIITPPMDCSLHGSCPNESTWEVDIEELIAATKDYEDLCSRRHFYENIRGFPFTPKVLPPGVTRLWVKSHAGGPTLRGEAYTQDYVHNEISKRGPPTSEHFYVPKVFDYAEFWIGDMIYSCIVMEFVTGTPISSIMKPTLWSREMSEEAKSEIVNPFKDRVAQALCFFLSLEPLPDTAPGPVNGGRIQNFVFGRDNSDAPQDFDTLEQLQDWINEENEKVCLETAAEKLLLKFSLCVGDTESLFHNKSRPHVRGPQAVLL